VAFSLDEAVSFCTFSLYDLSGNKLKSMNAGNLQSGNHIYSIGLNGIPGQILLLKMNTNQGTQQLKVIKLND
jgi:myo-inositol-hexaphosphate 3-phosphohydrolase